MSEVKSWPAQPEGPVEGIKIKGMFRLALSEPGGDKIQSVSDWYENLVTNLGFNEYLVSTLGAIAGSKQVTHAALGTGAAPAAGATTLPGEVVNAASNIRAAVTAATSSGSKTVRFTFTFNSSDSFMSATQNISNVGLFNTSATTTGTVFAGNTYASSAVATNQLCYGTYDLIFS